MERRFEGGWRGRLVKCPHCGKMNLFKGKCRKCGQILAKDV